MNGKIISLPEADNFEDDPTSETIAALKRVSFPALILILLILTRRDELSPTLRLWIMRLIERALISKTKRAA